MPPGTSCHPVFVPVHTCPSFSSLLSHISLISLLPVFFFFLPSQIWFIFQLSLLLLLSSSPSHTLSCHILQIFTIALNDTWVSFDGVSSAGRASGALSEIVSQEGRHRCTSNRPLYLSSPPGRAHVVRVLMGCACYCIFQNTELNDVTCMSQCQTRDKGNHSPPGSCKKKVWTAARVCQLERLCDGFNLYCKYFHVYGACFLEAIM